MAELKSEIKQIGKYSYKFTQLPVRISGKLYVEVGPKLLPIMAEAMQQTRKEGAPADPEYLQRVSAVFAQNITPEYLDKLIDILIPSCAVHFKEGPQQELWVKMSDMGGVDYLESPMELLEWVRAALEVQLGDFLSYLAAIQNGQSV